MNEVITGYTKTHRLEARITARNGHITTTTGGNTVAILCILGRNPILPPLLLHLPPLRLPLPPPEPPTPPARLHRNRSHDHHLFLPTDLLHLSMFSTLAIYLPRWGHHHGWIYDYNPVIPRTLNWKVSIFSCFSLHGDGPFRVITCHSWYNVELE